MVDGELVKALGESFTYRQAAEFAAHCTAEEPRPRKRPV